MTELANHGVMLDLRHVFKSFADTPALQDISFKAERGEIVALVGRNGAGKSTLMRIIANCLTADDGEIDFADEHTLGYLPEDAPLYTELTPRAVIQFVLGAHGYKGARLRRRLREILQTLDLEGVAGQTLATLSKGYQRRTALGMALAPDPKILILDEPFDGFDPIQKHAAVALLKSISVDKLILISTHSLSDAQRLCTRLIVLEDGIIRADATPEVLLVKTGKTTLDGAFRTLVAGAS